MRQLPQLTKQEQETEDVDKVSTPDLIYKTKLEQPSHPKELTLLCYPSETDVHHFTCKTTFYEINKLERKEIDVFFKIKVTACGVLCIIFLRKKYSVILQLASYLGVPS